MGASTVSLPLPTDTLLTARTREHDVQAWLCAQPHSIQSHTHKITMQRNPIITYEIRDDSYHRSIVCTFHTIESNFANMYLLI